MATMIGARRIGACVVLALIIGAIFMLIHAVSGPGAPGPAMPGLVSFQPASYSGEGTHTASGYGPPAVTVTVVNGNASPVTVHTVSVRFVDFPASRVIADMTAQADATVPGGQVRILTLTAPQAVANYPAGDSGIMAAVTGWS